MLREIFHGLFLIINKLSITVLKKKAEEVGADSDSADCSDTDSGVSDLEDENDVIDMQPAHPPRRSARLSAAADASQACSLVSPLSLVVCGGFPVVT